MTREIKFGAWDKGRGLENLGMEDLMQIIREYHQINIYTVDEEWVVQLLDINMCGNDEGECDWEDNSKDLMEVLRRAIDYISEVQND